MSSATLHPTRRLIVAAAVVVATATLLASCSSAAPSSTAAPASVQPTPSASPTPSPTAQPTRQPTPTATPLDQELLSSRFTVLLSGLDSDRWREAAGITETNTDALMVVSLSPDQSQLVLLSLPRDTVDIPMPDGSIYRGKVNAIERDLGIDALRDAVASLLGIRIDGYVQVDMDNFVRLVNTVGGIDVVVQTPVVDPGLGLNLQPGPAHLDGSQALYYSRTRVDLDYARAARQQQVLLAMVERYVDPSTQWSLPSLLVHLDSLKTDLDLASLPTLLELGRRAQDAGVTGTVLGPPRFALFQGIEGPERGWVMIPNVAEMRAYARSLIPD
jgi:LCP family protein required for cell wall assembly